MDMQLDGLLHESNASGMIVEETSSAVGGVDFDANGLSLNKSLDFDTSSSPGPSTGLNAVKFPDKGSDEFLKTLECPICLEIVIPPVINCTSGHIVCSLCLPRIDKCPLCNCSYSTIRNYPVEAILSLVETKCRHSLCSTKIKVDKLTEHLKICEYRPIPCYEYSVSKCNGRLINFEDYPQHLIEVHRTRCKTSDSPDFQRINLSNNLDVKWPIFQLSYQQQTYFLHRKSCSSHLMCWVSMMASETQAENHYVRLQIRHPVHHMKHRSGKAMDGSSSSSSGKFIFTSKTSETFLRNLECPVCLEIVIPPVTSCTLGHIICSICRPKLDKCGLCGSVFTSIRNYPIEAMLGLVETDCRYQSCTQQVKADRLKDHLLVCDYRPIPCFERSASLECSGQLINYEDYVKHVTESHGRLSYDLVEQYPDFFISDACTTFHGIQLLGVLTHNKNIFFLRREYFFPKQFAMCWVTAMMSDKEARKYVVHLNITDPKDGKRSVEWRIRAHSVHTSVDGVRNSGDCALIPYESLIPFCERKMLSTSAGQLCEYKWSIKGKITESEPPPLYSPHSIPQQHSSSSAPSSCCNLAAPPKLHSSPHHHHHPHHHHLNYPSSRGGASSYAYPPHQLGGGRLSSLSNPLIPLPVDYSAASPLGGHMHPYHPFSSASSPAHNNSSSNNNNNSSNTSSSSSSSAISSRTSSSSANNLALRMSSGGMVQSPFTPIYPQHNANSATSNSASNIPN